MSDDRRQDVNLEKHVGWEPDAEEFSSVQAAAAGLMPPHVGMGFCAFSNETDGRANATILQVGAEKRQREFQLGRRCGERALREVGWRPSDFDASEGVMLTVGDVTIGDVTAGAAVIGVGSDNCPQWPPGYVGSISHSRHWVWAVAATQRHYRGIGVDTEPIVSPELREMLQSEIGSAEEWQLMNGLGLPVPLQFTLLFSAKEAYFKLWYPLTRQFLNFDDVQLQGVLEKPSGATIEASITSVNPRIALILQCQQNESDAAQASTEWSRSEVVAAWSTHDVMTLTWLANTS